MLVRYSTASTKQEEAAGSTKDFIFDDDATYMIKFATGCSEGDADRLRRMLSKKDNEDLQFKKKLKDYFINQRIVLI